ncbi:MAG: hypothetical protein ACLTNO_01635 [Blautia sp.]
MAVFEGCEGGNKTWALEERGCPQCGAEMDVYTSSGRIVEDSVCSKCGYTIKDQEQLVTGLKREKEE